MHGAGRLLLLFVLCLVLPIAARAAEASRAPAEAFRFAAAYDARIAAARAALEASREQRAQGWALLLPALGFRADTTYNDLDVAFHQPHPLLPSGARRYNSNRYGVVLNQPLYDRANLARYRQSRTLATQAEIGYAVALQELILRVTQAYLDALLAEDTLRYLEAQLAASALGLFLKGVGLEVLWPRLGAIGLVGILLLAVAIGRSRRRMA